MFVFFVKPLGIKKSYTSLCIAMHCYALLCNCIALHSTAYQAAMQCYALLCNYIAMHSNA